MNDADYFKGLLKDTHQRAVNKKLATLLLKLADIVTAKYRTQRTKFFRVG
jgi:hypothetical protein